MPEFPPAKILKSLIKGAMTEQGYTTERANGLDHLDADITTRAAPGDILEDVGHKVNGEKIEEILVSESPVEGTASFAVADVYPKTVEIVKKEIGKPFFLEGLVNLSELADGESITLGEKAKLKAAGAYGLYADELYSGAQDEPIIHVKTLESVHGLSLELTMDSAPAADRDFDYAFFVRKKTV